VTTPTLIAQYYVDSAGNNTITLTTPSFTPANDEIIVIKTETWDTGTTMGSETGGGQTWTRQVTAAPGGFKPFAAITTTKVAGSPGAMTVSATPSGSCRHSMLVERWGNAQLAGTPSTATGTGTSGAAAGTITAAAGSVISWVAADINSLDPATRAYLGSATEEVVRDNHAGANSVAYYAYAVSTGGSQSFGLSAPSPMIFVIAGIELQAAAAVVSADAALSVTATLTTAVVVTGMAQASLTATATLTAAGLRTVPADAGLSVTATLTAGAAAVKPATGALSVTAVLTAGSGSLQTAGAALAVLAVLLAVPVLTPAGGPSGSGPKLRTSTWVHALRTTTRGG
jgi:hypothetical protein